MLYAPDYGVPQSRERVIFFGFKKNALTVKANKALKMNIIAAEYDPYPVKTHGDNLAPIVTCTYAFIRLVESDD